jgi:hypothetical protein
MSDDLNRKRQVTMSHRFDDLKARDAGPRLTRVLDAIFNGFNKSRVIQELPAPAALEAVPALGGVYLTWGALDVGFLESVYAARIWRVLESVDSATRFADNAGRRVLVPALMTTAWFDPTNNLDSYIYWVEWIDKLGRVSQPSNAAIAAGV